MERHILRDQTENNEQLELILHLLDFLSHIYGEDVKHGVGVLIQTLANVKNINKPKYRILKNKHSELGKIQIHKLLALSTRVLLRILMLRETRPKIL